MGQTHFISIASVWVFTYIGNPKRFQAKAATRKYYDFTTEY